MKTATTIYELANEVKAEDIWIYIDATNPKQVQEVLDSIYDNDVEDADSDIIFELCDSLVDVYTSDLYKWMDSSEEHKYYVEDAVQAGLVDTDNFDLDRAIMAGQYEQYRELFQNVIKYLEDTLVEEIEAEREEEEE